MTLPAVDPVIIVSIRWALALLFALAALHKAIDFAAFQLAVRDYQILPPILVASTAAALWLAEMGAAILLLIPSSAAYGAALAAALLLTYAAAIAINLVRGRTHIDCGCHWFSHRTSIGPGLVVRNVFLTLLAGVTLFPAAERPISLWDAALVGAAIAAAALIYTAANQLMLNRGPISASNPAPR